MIVWLCVCLSIKSQYSIKMAKYKITNNATQYPKIFMKCTGVIPMRVQNAAGGKLKLAIFKQ